MKNQNIIILLLVFILFGCHHKYNTSEFKKIQVSYNEIDQPMNEFIFKFEAYDEQIGNIDSLKLIDINNQYKFEPFFYNIYISNNLIKFTSIVHEESNRCYSCFFLSDDDFDSFRIKLFKNNDSIILSKGKKTKIEYYNGGKKVSKKEIKFLLEHKWEIINEAKLLDSIPKVPSPINSFDSEK